MMMIYDSDSMYVQLYTWRKTDTSIYMYHDFEKSSWTRLLVWQEWAKTRHVWNDIALNELLIIH